MLSEGTIDYATNNDPHMVHKVEKGKQREKKTVRPSLYQFKPKQSTRNLKNTGDSVVSNNSFASGSTKNTNKKVVHQYAPQKLVLSHSFKSTINNFRGRGVEASNHQKNPAPSMNVLKFPSSET